MITIVTKYPIYKPDLSGNEKKYVMECLDSSWISSRGEYITRFEQEFAKYIGVDYATGVCNGTVALHLALLALGVGEGDEVIVPTLTYIASVNAIAYTGAKPVFVDSIMSTWQMDINEIIKKISPKTKAILCVHLYGHPCKMDSLVEITRNNGIFLVEDCAEAIGSQFMGRRVGSFGDIATFSFYGNKTITTGEGGMLITNDKNLIKKSNHFKGQGLAGNREYWHDVIGYNYRMTNICGAIGLAQLENIDRIVLKKRKIAEWYREGLKDSTVEFHEEDHNVYHSYWMCSILVKNHEMREPLREYLKLNGVETRPVFYPIHTMPMYLETNESYFNAEDLGRRGINLPSYPTLSQSGVCEIVALIKDYDGKN